MQQERTRATYLPGTLTFARIVNGSRVSHRHGKFLAHSPMAASET